LGDPTLRLNGCQPRRCRSSSGGGMTLGLRAVAFSVAAVSAA